MPTFEREQKIEFDFEVYCGICGEGACNGSDVAETPGRRMPIVTVTCKTCEKELDEKSEEIKILETRIEVLEAQIQQYELKLEESQNV